MLKQSFMLIFSGPTAVGKSAIAEQLAQKIPADIINADVGQLYQPLSIGTAKPDWQNASVPHYLFDYIKDPKDITVVEYREQLIKTVNKVWQAGRLPIIVGGSSFYLASLFFPPQSQNLKKHKTYNKYNIAELWDKLYAIDQKRALQIHKQDEYRIRRALDIWHASGIKPSEYVPTYKPPAPYWFLFFTREKLILHQRINARVKKMIQQGWIQEVENIKGTEWESFLYRKKLIGYDDILSYLDTQQTAHDKEKLIETISRKTRYYAKKQRTFWRRLQHRLVQAIEDVSQETSNDMLTSKAETVDITNINIDTYTSQLAQELSILFLND